MAPLVFSNRIVNAMSWATDAPGGFAEADIELFRDLVFSTVIQNYYGKHATPRKLVTQLGG
jgi:adenylate cyclase